MSRRDFRFCSELIERGIFGFFFLLWIFLVSYLFIQSNSSYFSELGDSWNQEHNILFYETFQNKTDTGGPYHVYKSTVYIGGFVCGRSQHAIVYFPSNLQQLPSQQKYPLISFAHGFRAGGEKLDKDYSQLLIGLASWGFIIVAPESAPKKYCEEQYQDQLRIFEYLETNKIRHRAFASLDSSAYYGVLGHSMGGRSSIISATKEEYRIGAAAALHPVYTKAVTHVKIPILFGTGTDDIFVPPGTVKESYEETPEEVEKIYVNIEGATHYEPGRSGHNYWPDYLAAFFTCHLFPSSSSSTTIDISTNACKRVYGMNHDTCDLCFCPQKLPIESCKNNVMLIN